MTRLRPFKNPKTSQYQQPSCSRMGEKMRPLLLDGEVPRVFGSPAADGRRITHRCIDTRSFRPSGEIPSRRNCGEPSQIANYQRSCGVNAVLLN